MNATQIMAVQILKIEGIYTLEREKIVQEKRRGGGDEEIERFLFLERGGDVGMTEERRKVDGC